MPIVPVDQVRPGTRLLKSVTDAHGSVLFEAGRMLTHALITELLAANIRTVCVAGTLDRAKVEEMLSGLRKRFEQTRQYPLMPMLEELVAEHIEELYAQSEEGSLHR